MVGQNSQKFNGRVCDADRFNGKIDKKKNLFVFYHYYLHQMTLYVNGALLPNRPIEADFEQQLVTDAYQRLEEKRLNLTLYKFRNSHSIFDSTIRPDNSIRARGYTRLDCKFAKPLPKATVLLIIKSIDSFICFNAHIAVQHYIGIHQDSRYAY